MWGFGLSGSDQWGYMDNAKKVETPIVSGISICVTSTYVWIKF